MDTVPLIWRSIRSTKRSATPGSSSSTSVLPPYDAVSSTTGTSVGDGSCRTVACSDLSFRPSQSFESFGAFASFAVDSLASSVSFGSFGCFASLVSFKSFAFLASYPGDTDCRGRACLRDHRWTRPYCAMLMRDWFDALSLISRERP